MTLSPWAGNESVALAPSPSQLSTTVSDHRGTVVLRPQAAPVDQSWGTVTTIRVRDIIGYLRQYGKLSLAAAACAAAVTFVMLGMSPKVYEGESKIEARIQERNLLEVQGQSGGLSEQSSMQIMNNHRTNLTTRRFIDYLYGKVPAEQMNAYLDGVDQLGLRKRLFIALHLSAAPLKTSPQEQFAKKLGRSTRVEPLKDSHVMRISVRDTDPEVAANFANLYAQSYIEYIEDSNVSEARSAESRIESKVMDAKSKLAAVEAELAKFSQLAGLLKPGAEGDLSVAQADNFGKARADIAVELVRARERVRRLREAQASGRDIGGVRGLGDDMQIIEIQRKLIDARSRRDNLIEWCAPQHPKLLQVDSEITRMEKESQARIEAMVTAAEDDEKRLLSEKEQMTKMLDEARASAFGENTDRIRQKQLADEALQLRMVYAELVKQQEVAGLVADLRGNAHLDLIDTASRPEVPVWPIKSLALLGSMLTFGFIGLALPMGIGLSKDHLLPLLSPQKSEAAVKSSSGEDIAAVNPAKLLTPPVLNPKVLGCIPYLRAESASEMVGELLRPSHSGAPHTISVLSRGLETYRAKRGGTGVLLVTSPTAGEGKSLLASGLAASLCTVGKKVLLMDGNPTSAALASYFPGVGAHSSARSDLASLRYGQSDLFVLPGHDLPSYEMSELVEGYRRWIGIALVSGLDWVIIDAASLLENFADVAQLSVLATDVLLVNDATRSASSQVRAAVNLLSPLTKNTLRGVVCNRVAASL